MREPHFSRKLREEIHAAFAWRSYPGDDHLALPGPGCPGDDREDVGRFFRAKDWREVTLAAITESDLDPNAFLFFMSAEAFVYYLPAFLTESLAVVDGFDLGEPLAFKLTPPQGNPQDPGLAAARTLFNQIVSALTPEEKQAVVRALKFLAREYDKRGDTMNRAQAALDSHWAELGFVE